MFVDNNDNKFEKTSHTQLYEQNFTSFRILNGLTCKLYFD